MHGAGVIRDDELAAAHPFDHFSEIGFTQQIDRIFTVAESAGERPVTAATQDREHILSRTGELVERLSEMFSRPAFVIPTGTGDDADDPLTAQRVFFENLTSTGCSSRDPLE